MWRSVTTFAFDLSLIVFKQDEFGWNLVFENAIPLNMFLLKLMYKKEKSGRSSNTVTFLPRKVYPGAGEQLLETNMDM